LQPGAGEYRHATRYLAHREPDQLGKFTGLKRRAFAGRAGNDETARTSLQLVFDQATHGFEVKRVVGDPKWRCHRAYAS
jgi:hypothetical protein